MDAVLPGMTGWLADLATGPVATGLGILAVMALGLAALLGNLDKAKALRAVFGLALVFAAPALARQMAHISAPQFAAPQRNESPDDQGVMASGGICWTCR